MASEPVDAPPQPDPPESGLLGPGLVIRPGMTDGATTERAIRALENAGLEVVTETDRDHILVKRVVG